MVLKMLQVFASQEDKDSSFNRTDATKKNIVSFVTVQNETTSLFRKAVHCPAASRFSVGVAIEFCAFVNAPGVFHTRSPAGNDVRIPSRAAALDGRPRWSVS
jgi:hypothetical protein